MSQETRPWGWYETFIEEEGYKVKRITVVAEQSISLQYHNHREEHWTIVNGEGYVTIGDVEDPETLVEYYGKVGDSFHIKTGEVHRIRGGERGVIFVEVQIGDKCEEKDIVRLEDEYGRN